MKNAEFCGADAENITFAYNEEVILKNYNIDIQLKNTENDKISQ